MKKSVKLISGLLALVLLFSLFPFALAAPAAAAVQPPLTVTIETNKASYGTLGMASINIAVTNNSDSAVKDVHVNNAVPEQLNCFAYQALNTYVDSLAPGESINISYDACLNPAKAPVNAFLKLFLRIKLYFLMVNGSVPSSPITDTPVLNDTLFAEFDTAKDINFGKVTVTNTVKVSYLSLPGNLSAGSIEEIVSAYNTAANATKGYAGEVTVSKISGITMDASGNDLYSSLLQTFYNGDFNLEKATFVNGISGTDTLINFLPPQGNAQMSTLTADGVQSALSAPIGGKRLVVINLVNEDCDAMNPIPPHHSSCMDILDLSNEDFDPFTASINELNYTGATIIAVINEGGNLDFLYIRNPIQYNITMTLSESLEITVDVLFVLKQYIEFEY